jgi:2-octaprenyl-6-methoxyphenol hydroxylase
MNNLEGHAPTQETAAFDAIVVGGGPAGLAAALALAQAHVRTALIARRLPYADNRTTALLGSSIDNLTRLHVWQSCEDKAAPLRIMRLVDSTDRLLRAPEVRFDCAEIGLAAFGYNIENRNLLAAMEERAAGLDNLVRFDDDAAAVESCDGHGTVHCKNGTSIKARLIVGADGRHSICRDAAGIAVERRPLDQAALTFNVMHSRPHQNISTEFHTARGPCVFVPLPGDRSSVVWVTTPAEAARLAALDDDKLSAAIERQSHFHLGQMRVEAGRHVFPLAFEQPRCLAARRIALIGEAAHVVPPIGAQGLNLGLRDAIGIADVAAQELARHGDPGSPQALTRYEQLRIGDITTRGVVIELANRTLLADFVPLQAIRALGMKLLDKIGPLRRLIMREAMAASKPDPANPDRTTRS